jgi:hypothetical protein
VSTSCEGGEWSFSSLGVAGGTLLTSGSGVTSR